MLLVKKFYATSFYIGLKTMRIWQLI